MSEEEEPEAYWADANALQSSSLPYEEAQTQVTICEYPEEARVYSPAQYEELFAANNARPTWYYEPLHVRPEWALIVASEEPPSVANSILSLSQITREAVRLFTNTNEFLARLRDDGSYPASSVPSDTAHRRSLKLLESWLSEEQLESFRKRGSFEVTGGTSGVRYLLRSEYSFGITPLEGHRRGSRLCVVPSGAGALGDILLAQKIGLEREELATLALANVGSASAAQRFGDARIR